MEGWFTWLARQPVPNLPQKGRKETCSMPTHRTSGSLMLPPNSPKRSASHRCCSHTGGCVSLQLSVLTALIQVQAEPRALQHRALCCPLGCFFHRAVGDSVATNQREHAATLTTCARTDSYVIKAVSGQGELNSDSFG